jgi:hypothetical protein
MMNFTLGMLFPKKQLTAEQRKESYWSEDAESIASFREMTAT